MEPLLETLANQLLRPDEIIIVDGAPPGDQSTEEAVTAIQSAAYPIPITYIRSQERGTSVQRNVGVDCATGDYIALIDDDIRLESNFFLEIMRTFNMDSTGEVGGVTGHRQNLAHCLFEVPRWRWYKRLGLFSTYESGRYDYETGYPINQNLVPPFEGIREMDFVTTACTVWRRQVFDAGLRFSNELTGYAVIEDAHFSLRAGRNWRLVQCGSARCIELKAPAGRVGRRELGYKKVYNYRFLFVTVVPERSWKQEFRFWYVQCILMLQLMVGTLLRRDPGGVAELLGRLHGTWDAYRMKTL